MKELFEKIYIYKKDDIPEEGEYIAHFKKFEQTPMSIVIIDVEYFTDMSGKINVDWYLRPVEIKFPDEEIINKAADVYSYTDSTHKEYYAFIDAILWTINWIKENNK